MGGRRGFTLVELLVVIGICGLFFSLSFSTLTGFKELLCLEARTRDLVSELRKTQARAMSKNEKVVFGKFAFSGSGFPLPGGSGTQVLRSQLGHEKRIVLSSMGRIRVE